MYSLQYSKNAKYQELPLVQPPVGGYDLIVSRLENFHITSRQLPSPRHTTSSHLAKHHPQVHTVSESSNILTPSQTTSPHHHTSVMHNIQGLPTELILMILNPLLAISSSIQESYLNASAAPPAEVSKQTKQPRRYEIAPAQQQNLLVKPGELESERDPLLATIQVCRRLRYIGLPIFYRKIAFVVLKQQKTHSLTQSHPVTSFLGLLRVAPEISQWVESVSIHWLDTPKIAPETLITVKQALALWKIIHRGIPVPDDVEIYKVIIRKGLIGKGSSETLETEIQTLLLLHLLPQIRHLKFRLGNGCQALDNFCQSIRRRSWHPKPNRAEVIPVPKLTSFHRGYCTKATGAGQSTERFRVGVSLDSCFPAFLIPEITTIRLSETHTSLCDRPSYRFAEHLFPGSSSVTSIYLDNGALDTYDLAKLLLLPRNLRSFTYRPQTFNAPIRPESLFCLLGQPSIRQSLEELTVLATSVSTTAWQTYGLHGLPDAVRRMEHRKIEKITGLPPFLNWNPHAKVGGDVYLEKHVALKKVYLSTTFFQIGRGHPLNDRPICDLHLHLPRALEEFTIAIIPWWILRVNKKFARALYEKLQKLIKSHNFERLTAVTVELNSPFKSQDIFSDWLPYSAKLHRLGQEYGVVVEYIMLEQK